MKCCVFFTHMSTAQDCSAHVVKVIASISLYSFHMCAVQCSKTKKRPYFLQKNVMVPAVMNLDFVSSSGSPPSHVTTLFKATAKPWLKLNFK